MTTSFTPHIIKIILQSDGCLYKALEFGPSKHTEAFFFQNNFQLRRPQELCQMEASRPPLKRNRSKGNIQINKKYQHLNWPNALTKNENDSDAQSSSTGNFFTQEILRKFLKTFCV